MNDMNGRDQWANEPILIDYLAHQLTRGRLGLFLGAGISSFYGLPEWAELIKRLCAANSETLAASDGLMEKAAYLRARYYKNDTDRFIKDLKAALYAGRVLDFKSLRSSETLAAIGSLVMSSQRGSAAKVFTLNFDDLLENYLEFHGFTTSVIFNEKHWSDNSDVTVYHPHGLVPLADRPGSKDVIIGSTDYHEIMQSPTWRPLLESALRTHTFLFIGLSGTDLHLQGLLHAVKDKHAVKNERVAYSGVRFSRQANDQIAYTLDSEGIFTHQLSGWDRLAEFLFAICQSARTQRMKGV